MIYSIQYMRAIAAFLVVLTHVATKGAKYSSDPLAWFNIGGAGVDLFFIISGYIMCHTVEHKEPNFPGFIKARVHRIIPLYWTLTTFALVVFLLFPDMINSSGGNTNIITSYLLFPTESKFLVQAGWTLTYEFFFYFLFSSCFFVKKSYKFFIPVLIIAAMVSISFELKPANYQAAYLSDPILLEFVFGILAFYFARKFKIKNVYGWLLVGLSIVAMVIVNNPSFSDVSRVIRFGLPVWLFFTGMMILEPWFQKHSSKPGFKVLKEMGNSSYSLYLTHPFSLVILSIVLARLGINKSGILFVVLLSIGAVVSGHLCYFFIEKPLSRLTKLKRKKQRHNNAINDILSYMKLTVVQRNKIRELLWICGASGLLGFIFSIGIHLLVLHESTDSSIVPTVLLGTLTGVFLSLSLTLLGDKFHSSGRKPLWFDFFIIPLLFTLIISVEYSILFIFILGIDTYMTNSFIWETIGFSLLITFCVNFLSAINRLLGQNVLKGLITGKYHRPVNEERFVLFLDLVGSTSTAEKIGNQSFHSFLNDFFCDLSKPVINLHGDIYKYVGDEVIITWKKNAGMASDSVLSIFFEIQRVIDERKKHYQTQYGIIPQFRAGLHFGTVVVGEMGDYKQEIALLGDVMNTASRIQAECRNLSVQFLVSEDAQKLLSPKDGKFGIVSCGAVELRGKQSGINLYSVTQSTTA